MNAETRTLQDVLHGDRRFVVPVYQRPYVWDQERQWQPLWDDVEATVDRLARSRSEGFNKGLELAHADAFAAPHFLGAIVLELHPTPTGDVDTRLVVDGQQRLVTIQLMFRGVLDALEKVKAEGALRAKVRKAINNDAEVVSPSELLKVSPRLAERPAFAEAMDPQAPTSDASVFGAARAFFEASALGLLQDSAGPSDPYADEESDGETVAASLLVSTILGLVKLVVIDLDTVDDAQVIFEALNARNTPLSATDLVKNLLFLRALKENEDPQNLYDTLWRRFDDDDDWWLSLTGVGHAQRARQDWLLGDWLIAETGRAINVGRLYGEFKSWLDLSGLKALHALSTLNEYADAYEALHARREGATPNELEAFRRVEELNIAVATPVLLWLFVQPSDVLPLHERELAFRAIESYVVRRMAAKWQTRAYGQVFVDVLRAAQESSSSPGKAVIAALRSSPHQYAWPTTADLQESFFEGRYYGPGGINQARLRLLLGEIDRYLQTLEVKPEPLEFDYSQLQIEHIIPQSWADSWPVEVEDQALMPVAEQERQRHLNRIGNLTLVTGPLNLGMSNNPWEAKKSELRKHSRLRLNAVLMEEEMWTEAKIAERGKWLASQLEHVWPGPESSSWD